MSIFAIMNYVAWALCGVVAYLLISDVVKVEKQKRAEREAEKDAEKKD
ncbi:MAG: hypothetical protein J6J03_05290 [Tyzzerella sp.]|nr:hypothetical protein [Tyzzerella sp.]